MKHVDKICGGNGFLFVEGRKRRASVWVGACVYVRACVVRGLMRHGARDFPVTSNFVRQIRATLQLPMKEDMVNTTQLDLQMTS